MLLMSSDIIASTFCDYYVLEAVDGVLRADFGGCGYVLAVD